MPAIKTTVLTKRYGSTTAVDQLDLTVPDGTVFGFLGPNGAGVTINVNDGMVHSQTLLVYDQNYIRTVLVSK